LRRSTAGESKDAPSTRSQLGVYLGLTCAMLLFGMSFVFTSVALESLGPVTIILIRLLISIAMIWLISRLPAVVAVVGRIGRLPRAHLPHFALIALFQPFLYFLSENYGLLFVPPSVASVVVGTIPVVTPIFAFFLLRERVTVVSCLGFVMSFVGVAVLVLDGEAPEPVPVFGVLLVFGAVLAAVGYSIVLRLLPGRYSALSVVFYQNLIGAAYFLPVFVFLEARTVVPGEVPPEAIGAVLFLGLLPSTVSFVFLNAGIRRLGATKANVFTNLVPIFAAIASYFLVGEAFTQAKILGMAITIGGVVLSQTVGRRRDPETIAAAG